MSHDKFRRLRLTCLVMVSGVAAACGSPPAAAPKAEEADPAPMAPSGPIARPPVGPDDLAVVAASDPGSPFSSDVFRAGLVAWRTPHPKGACASCHTPDAVDLARINYSDAVILRRALQNESSVEDAFAIVDLVHWQRKRLGFTNPVDPLAFRPLQPGGAPLPGATDAERDEAFYDQLRAMGLDVAQDARIDSLPAAQKALGQILALDLRKLRIGIELNRWTEDAIRGDAHRTINKWIPELPSVPKPGEARAWYELHNQYIEHPTPANLWSYVTRAGQMTDANDLVPVRPGSPEFMNVMASKYQAVQVAGHMMRVNDTRMPEWTVPEKPFDAFKTDADMAVLHDRVTRLWEVGAAAKGATFPDPEWVPDFVLQKMPSPPGFERASARDLLTYEMVRTRVTWFWLGMIYNPSLQFSGGANREEYFIEGIAIYQHDSAHKIPVQDAFRDALFFAHINYGMDTRYPNMFANGQMIDLLRGCGAAGAPEPQKDGLRDGHRSKYGKLVANIARMHTYLSLDYFARGGGIDMKEDGRRERFWEPCLARTEQALAYETSSERAAFAPVLQALRKAGDAAPRKNTPAFDERNQARHTTFVVSPMLTQSQPMQLPDGADRTPKPGKLGAMYQRACAGCHGEDGEGRVDPNVPGVTYPPLRGLTFEQLRSIVRAGKTGPVAMPGFPAERVTDGELQALADSLSTR